MFVEEKVYGIKCDRCKDLFENYNNISYFSSKSDAIEQTWLANWGGHDSDTNLHYCSSCIEAMQEEKEVNEPIVIRYKVIVRLYDFGYVFAKGSIIDLKGDSKNEPKFETKSSLSSKVTYYKSFFELNKENFKLLSND